SIASCPSLCCSIPVAYCISPCSSCHPRSLHSFPTRRSSDLFSTSSNVHSIKCCLYLSGCEYSQCISQEQFIFMPNLIMLSGCASDRKSTRLNSSHVSISYAVFCLKKKK